MPDAEGRTRILFDLSVAVKDRVDKLPFGTRGIMFASLTEIVMNEIDRQGWKVLHAIMDKRVRIVVDEEEKK